MSADFLGCCRVLTSPSRARRGARKGARPSPILGAVSRMAVSQNHLVSSGNPPISWVS